MLKRYFHRNPNVKGDSPEVKSQNENIDESEVEVTAATAVACVLEDEKENNGAEITVRDADLLSLYNNVKQTETVEDVKINPELTSQQQREVRQLLLEYKEIFSDVPTVTHLI